MRGGDILANFSGYSTNGWMQVRPWHDPALKPPEGRQKISGNSGYSEVVKYMQEEEMGRMRDETNVSL